MPIPKPEVRAAERKLREEAVRYATASVGLEGFEISAIDKARAQRFIEGDISLDEFLKPSGEAGDE